MKEKEKEKEKAKAKATELVSLRDFLAVNVGDISLSITKAKSTLFKQSEFTVAISIQSLGFLGEALRKYDQFSAFYEAVSELPSRSSGLSTAT